MLNPARMTSSASTSGPAASSAPTATPAAPSAISISAPAASFSSTPSGPAHPLVQSSLPTQAVTGNGKGVDRNIYPNYECIVFRGEGSQENDAVNRGINFEMNNSDDEEDISDASSSTEDRGD